MNTPLEWVTGPLGFPASKNWSYWTPRTADGTYRAWFFPRGLPSWDEELIGEGYLMLESAQRACDAHAVGRRC